MRLERPPARRGLRWLDPLTGPRRDTVLTVFDGAATTGLVCAAVWLHSGWLALLAGFWAILYTRQWRLAAAHRRARPHPRRNRAR